MQFNIINLLVLLGSVQGFTLCVFLWKKRKINPTSYLFFIVFLFSLAFFNLSYALHYSEVYKIESIPLTSFPFPYKYLIGVAFYFYVKSQLLQNDTTFYKKESYLFIPAILYGALRGYWYYIIIQEGNNRIFREVYLTGFFTYNEFVYLGFNLVIIALTLRLLNKHKESGMNIKKVIKNYAWLKKFSITYFLIIGFNLMIFASDLLINFRDTIPFYYVILLVNTLFIYWIGFEGFKNPSAFFSSMNLKKSIKQDQKYTIIRQKLHKAIEEDEVFMNKNLRLSNLAYNLELSEKDISSYINEVHRINFSEYLNRLRVEKVKSLLSSDEVEKYTLVTLAETAGFSSKSTFNTVFKKITGVTPSEYKRQCIK